MSLQMDYQQVTSIRLAEEEMPGNPKQNHHLIPEVDSDLHQEEEDPLREAADTGPQHHLTTSLQTPLLAVTHLLTHLQDQVPTVLHPAIQVFQSNPQSQMNPSP